MPLMLYFSLNKHRKSLSSISKHETSSKESKNLIFIIKNMPIFNLFLYFSYRSYPEESFK